ncbi:MAG: hypothetical protein NTZ35_01305 [Ignavibacteriales bacterium]|nr:hypothetical protein [Ignavibacteriales bacterium]
MSLKSKWLFVFVGNNETGKTTLQKKIVKLLSDDNRDIRLDCNLVFHITHPYLIRKLSTFSIGNRSYQEKVADYHSVREYFDNHMPEADFYTFSTHLVLADVEQIITHAHAHFLNVCGIFLRNSIEDNPVENAAIAQLPWDEKLYADNPKTDIRDTQDEQLQRIAETLVQMLIHRAPMW